MQQLQVGHVYPIAITDLAVGGEAIGRVDGFVLFVEDGAPGDEVEVEVTELRKNFGRGRISRFIHSSPQRRPPPCSVYSTCGGCQLQHLQYEAQLAFKHRVVEDALRLSRLRDIPIHACSPAPEWAYRNKMQLVAGGNPPLPPGEAARTEPEGGGGWLGLYARHTHHVVRTEECLIAHPLANRILQAASHALADLKWPVYDEKSGQGMLRHVMARVSASRNEALVVLVATTASLPGIEQFVSMLRTRVPEVVGVLVNFNPQRTNVILGRRTHLIWGRDHVVEDVAMDTDCGTGTPRLMQFRIGATAFFQVNPQALSTLSAVAARYLNPRVSETIVDAYSGVGVMALLLADRVRRVVGIEEVPAAVEAARMNAAGNHVRNADFVCGRVEQILPQMVRRNERVDACLLDPPRKGCDAEVLSHLAKLHIPRLVYISCSPPTLGRDLAILAGLGYRTEEIQPVDMFPQTAHVECVARLVYDPSRAGATLAAPSHPVPTEFDLKDPHAR